MHDKLFNKKFSFVLGLTALSVALCAAAFSVYGIGTLFIGVTISAMIMASVLEIGKIVATTFLYRYWTRSKLILRMYLSCAVLLLMVITSLGIFGYLSAGYQKSSIEFKVSQDKIELLQNQKPNQENTIKSSRIRIEELNKLRSMQESRLSEVLTNATINRNPILLRQVQEQTAAIIDQTESNIKDENTRILRTTDELSKIDNKINELKLGSADKKDIQTFKFVADALGLTLDTVAKWFIIMIIVVFDPLAICLILAYNVSLYRKEDDSVHEPKDLSDKIEPIIETTVNIPTPKEVVTDTNNTSNVVPSVPSSVPAVPAVVEQPQAHYDNFAKGYFK